MFYCKATYIQDVDGATFWQDKHCILNTWSLYRKNWTSLNSEASHISLKFLEISIDKKSSTFCTHNKLDLLIKIEFQSHCTN